MKRVSVVGNSGSGKSTLSSALAGRLGVPWLELDSIFHMSGWQPRPLEEFRAEVERFTAADGWVVDGNYSAVRDLVWSRADTVVWIVYRERYARARADPANAHLRFVRVASRADAARLIATDRI
ncbi:hypothetical protein ACGFJC_31490 [Nonomuraea fuscirosea]|uniref:hypothetical protein n=1 Tax=Nonomuraea fuscirosea TaxID=1291556 RepID=UPI00371EAA41